MMNIEIKDLISLIVGTAIGLVAGIAIYWLPLGQFLNEWRAIWNLTRRQYRKGNNLVVKAGTALKPLDPIVPIATIGQSAKSMMVWNDEGVAWHFTQEGWKRVRVLHVFDPVQQGTPDVYKISHLDIE